MAELTEDVEPEGQNPVVQKGTFEKVDAVARTVLAAALMAVIALLSIVASIGWMRGAPSAAMQDLVTFMGPILTLAGVVFTFYFTKRS